MKDTQNRPETSKRNNIICCLGIIAAFVTAYALMLPAITMEAVPCALAEHTHTNECYGYTAVSALSVEELTDSDELVCTAKEGEGHIHREECIGEDGIYVCGDDEYEVHTHDISCYSTKVLICEYEEHIHSDECGEIFTDDTVTEIITESTENAVLMSEAPVILNSYDSSEMSGDINTVSGEGITFRLFNYSTDINKTADKSAWREISQYFTFRNSSMSAGVTPSDEINIPSPNMNAEHDVDGFTAKHATVRRVLDEDGYPVLDLTRNADGTSRIDPGVDDSVLSLAYLFSDMGDHAVTAYTPANTVLQRSGTHYWYNSMDNAVDYDIDEGIFRVRSYAERNSTTAANSRTVQNADGSSSVRPYGDFIPFTYTGGETVGTDTDTGYEYHVESENTDYWFGMSMEVEFFQTKDGIVLNEETGSEEEMIFSFSGDDDVWVFVDDVLVLDLGGTHGTVDGSVNFATGEILQYLSWNDANSTDAAKKEGSATSFPTSIKECFDAAARTPSGGWSEDGKTFADYTKHTLKFFYLERGSAVANCHLDFRLPTLPDKSLTVSKDLTKDSSTVQEGAVEEFIESSLSYRFRVVKAEDSAPTDELFILPGTAYDIMQSGVKIAEGAVDSDGYFSLKAGQSAQFTEMLGKGNGHTDYIVEEVLPNALTGQYGGVEYSVSSDTGSTVTEGEEKEDFTYFHTKVLSAQQSQTVVYRNKVDISELCTLKITKRQAQGSEFSPEDIFRMRIQLGDELLPAGTGYTINGTAHKVAEEGIIELHTDETAVIGGILSGTYFEITELGAEDGSFNASYTGEASSDDCKISAGSNGVTGEFALNSTIGVTVTNASYDFAAGIPISKQCIDNDADVNFSFGVVELIKDGESFIEGDSLPGTIITVTDESTVGGRILIGYNDGTSGTFFYRISEEKTGGDYIFDDTFYIVQTDVNGKDAVISHIWKNGTEEISPTDTLSFVNRKTTSLTVTKRVIADGNNVLFPFSVTVMLDGKPFEMPRPQNGADYTTTGHVISFELGDGDVMVIPGIPYNAVVTVKEISHDGFIPHYRVDGIDAEAVGGDSVNVYFSSDAMTVEFTNKMSYMLPETGGRGTEWFTMGGMFIVVAALLWYKKEHRTFSDAYKNRR
ncbi:MAG: fibro-slime domain-containing protein [Anaerofustis stercorihominis]|nr:fibro-slime domain-containing protein [Anaerofustis stercorihominis]